MQSSLQLSRSCTPTQTRVVLTFSGAGTTAGSLDDGRYTLTVVAAQVTGPKIARKGAMSEALPV